MNADYDLISHWRVRGKLADAASILSEPRDLVHWWPEVYLAIDVLDEGDEAGIGQVARVMPEAGSLTRCAGPSAL